MGARITARHTVPLLLAGSLAAMTLQPAEPATAAEPVKPKGGASELGRTLRGAVQSAFKSTTAAFTRSATAPATYVVVAGDTVSSIAAQYGLSTASVLALNGLDWSTLIFPGQQLRLSVAGPVAPVAPQADDLVQRYTIVAGDSVSGIAERYGVTTVAILTANGLSWSSIIYPGQAIVIPPPVPTPPLADAPTSAPGSDPTSWTVQAGDTVWSIAQARGVSTEAVLAANGLGAASLIFPGQVLVVPAPGAAAAPEVPGLDAEAAANAQTIVRVGRELGVSDYGIVIALAAAAQESTLRNLDWGDRDSVGLFQQRPSTGWGTVEQLTTPEYAARLFYGGPSNPNAGSTRGLLDIDGWEWMSVTEAAQAVQTSAYPDAYAKWESSAWDWLAALSS